jgi:flagellar hook-length control protein FliK
MFSALDAGTSPGTPAWTHAGSQHAEAGFRDPALGWVSVRADLNGGGIHATLVPSSAEAAQALNGHLAGLSTHLVEQQSPVASLTMASPSESAVENGMGQRMQQSAEGNSQGSAPEEAQAGSQENAPPAASTSVLDAPAQAGIRDSFAHTGDLRGTHISVMA